MKNRVHRDPGSYRSPRLQAEKRKALRDVGYNRIAEQLYATAAWKHLRACVLADEPTCRKCRKRPSTVADHIVPHEGRADLFFDRENLQGLCKPCHDRKTTTVDGFGIRDNMRRKEQGEGEQDDGIDYFVV